MGPIGSAVLTFIGYKQTDKQTDKPNLYIDVQKRAVNMVTGLSKDLSYPAKLQLLGLETLEERRHRLDMINTYKILNKKMSVDPNTWFSRVQDNSRRPG